MMKDVAVWRKMRRAALLTVAMALVLCTPLCAKKKNKEKDVPEIETSTAVAGDEGTMINIRVPQKERTYFSGIDDSVVSMVEAGSPASLRQAVSALQVMEQTENVRVLISVADGIMRTVWQSESADWKITPVTTDTPYTGAIESARSGIYDTSTGNKDFLALVLPSLVVVVRQGKTADYDKQAEKALQDGLNMRPNSVLAQYLLGMLYNKEGREAEALPLLRGAYKASNCKEVSFALTGTLNALGDKDMSYKDEAFRLASILVTRYPNDVEVLGICAESAYAFKDYNAAEGYVSRLLQNDPNNTTYILFRAKTLIALGDYIRATSMLDIYARRDTTAKDYLLLRAKVQRDWSGNMSAALTTCEDALNRYPNDEEVLLLAASIAARNNGSVGGRNAVELADAALMLNPNSTEAVKYKIDALVDAGEWQKAYKESAWVLRGEGEKASKESIFTHIRICLEVRRGDEAWTLISPLYKANPADEAVLRSYVTVLCRTGRTAEALTLINKGLGTANSNMRSFYYYQRSLLQSTQEAALADLRSALIASPRNKDALFRLYQVYFDNRDYRKAQYYLKQVIALDRGNAAMLKLDEELQRLVR